MKKTNFLVVLISVLFLAMVFAFVVLKVDKRRWAENDVWLGKEFSYATVVKHTGWYSKEEKVMYNFENESYGVFTMRLVCVAQSHKKSKLYFHTIEWTYIIGQDEPIIVVGWAYPGGIVFEDDLKTPAEEVKEDKNLVKLGKLVNKCLTLQSQALKGRKNIEKIVLIDTDKEESDRLLAACSSMYINK